MSLSTPAKQMRLDHFSEQLLFEHNNTSAWNELPASIRTAILLRCVSMRAVHSTHLVPQQKIPVVASLQMDSVELPGRIVLPIASDNVHAL